MCTETRDTEMFSFNEHQIQSNKHKTYSIRYHQRRRCIIIFRYRNCSRFRGVVFWPLINRQKLLILIGIPFFIGIVRDVHILSECWKCAADSDGKCTKIGLWFSWYVQILTNTETRLICTVSLVVFVIGWIQTIKITAICLEIDTIYDLRCPHQMSCLNALATSLTWTVSQKTFSS